jgi:hypothetical protein
MEKEEEEAPTETAASTVTVAEVVKDGTRDMAADNQDVDRIRV